MGLTDNEVIESRKKFGSNVINSSKKNSFIKQYIATLGDPIIRILLIALGIKTVFLIKNFDWYETVGIVIAIFLASFISTVSEYGSEKAFEKLQEESKQWKIIRTYSEELPKGGENGRDGYIDADYQSINGEIIRFVCRNVFDVGRYNYPKRVEGTKDVLDSSNWTEAEHNLSDWLCKFGQFGTFGKYRGFRM